MRRCRPRVRLRIQGPRTSAGVRAKDQEDTGSRCKGIPQGRLPGITACRAQGSHSFSGCSGTCRAGTIPDLPGATGDDRFQAGPKGGTGDAGHCRNPRPRRNPPQGYRTCRAQGEVPGIPDLPGPRAIPGVGALPDLPGPRAIPGIPDLPGPRAIPGIPVPASWGS